MIQIYAVKRKHCEEKKGEKEENCCENPLIILLPRIPFIFLEKSKIHVSCYTFLLDVLILSKQGENMIKQIKIKERNRKQEKDHKKMKTKNNKSQALQKTYGQHIQKEHLILQEVSFILVLLSSPTNFLLEARVHVDFQNQNVHEFDLLIRGFICLSSSSAIIPK